MIHCFQNADTVDIEQAKQQSPREMELVVLKNRNAITGNVVPLGYYAEYNIFTENVASNNKNPVYGFTIKPRLY